MERYVMVLFFFGMLGLSVFLGSSAPQKEIEKNGIIFVKVDTVKVNSDTIKINIESCK